METQLFAKCLCRVVLLTLVFVGTGCSMYPLGGSHYPTYFGGHGSAVRPNGHVPAKLQRVNSYPE
jgi:hypothetical protein